MMQEVVTVQDAYNATVERLRVVAQQLDLEWRQGLEGDFTAVAEAFETIRDLAAWIIEYEAAS